MDHLVRLSQCLQGLSERLRGLETALGADCRARGETRMPLGVIRFRSNFRSGAAGRALRGAAALGAVLSFGDKELLSVLGHGEDGVVVKVTYTDERVESVKLYIKELQSDNIRSREMNRIREDQANREFKGLNLVKGNPHFPSLISTELDTCGIELDDWSVSRYGPFKDAWAIRMGYLEDSYSINHLHTCFGVETEGGAIGFNAVLLSDTFCCVAIQMTDAVRFLQEKGIFHRDLDACNVMVRLADFNVVIIDFAKADVPGMTPPVEFCDSRIKAIVQETPAHKNTAIALYERAYSNPLSVNDDSDDPSDTEAVFLMLIERLKTFAGFAYQHVKHVYDDFIKEFCRDIFEKFDTLKKSCPAAPRVGDPSVDFGAFAEHVRDECRMRFSQAEIAAKLVGVRRARPTLLDDPSSSWQFLSYVIASDRTRHELVHEGGAVKRARV